MIITTSTRVTPALESEAKRIADELGLPYIERRKRAFSVMRKLYGDVLLLSKERLSLEYANGQTFFFHPDTAVLRIKAKRDPLIELIGEDSQTILDTTMGLASDAIVMSYAGHTVTALESQQLIHYLVARGLQKFESKSDAINQAMRAIQPICVDSLDYLKQQADGSVDVIYCDPMFSEKISESDNLDGIKPLANFTPFTADFLKEALRVAKKKVIIKAHFRDTVFEDFGFTRFVRPYQKFHFGVIEK